MPEPKQVLRIIDANLNRASEGLRVLEDVARFVLDDAALSQQLKTMRHRITEVSPPFNQQLLQARDSADDVGASMEAEGQEKQRELPAVIVANSRRVQEALRVIEEMAKVPGIELESDKFKQARFDLYTIEQSLVSKLANLTNRS